MIPNFPTFPTTGHVLSHLMIHIRSYVKSCYQMHRFIKPILQHSFCPRPVLTFGYCRCLRLSVCSWVYQPLACPHDNSGPVQAGITKFGPGCAISWVKSLLFWGAIDFDLQCQIQLKMSKFPVSPLQEIHNHHITPEGHEYQDCLAGLIVSWSQSSACTFNVALVKVNLNILAGEIRNISMHFTGQVFA